MRILEGACEFGQNGKFGGDWVGIWGFWKKMSGGGLFRRFGRKTGLEGFSGGIWSGIYDGYLQKPSIYQHFRDFFWGGSCAGKRKNYICIEFGYC